MGENDATVETIPSPEEVGQMAHRGGRMDMLNVRE
jgi:hypothetical protein